MATAKFKDVSPFEKKQRSPPPEDYIYQKYLKDVALKGDLHASQVKLALFGVGRAGSIHLANIIANPLIKLLYIVDEVESNWDSIRNYWHLEDVIFLNSKQSDKVYNDPNVDAVMVTTPSATHEKIVNKSLEAHKAVFCEKPIAADRLSTTKCYETAQKVGKPLFCAFNRRFDPSYAALRAKVRSGEIGHVHTIKTISKDSPLPSIEYLKISGGIFHDCMVHDFDMMTWILGEYPIRVVAQAHAHIPEIKEISDYDTVVATLYFPSGTLGMIEISRNSCYGYDQRVEVFGPKGMITADNEQPIPSVTSHFGLEGPKAAPIWYSFASRFMHAYKRELDHFVDIVLGKAESSVLPKETLAVCKVACACEESVRTGKIVEIKWAPHELPASN